MGIKKKSEKNIDIGFLQSREYLADQEDLLQAMTDDKQLNNRYYNPVTNQWENRPRTVDVFFEQRSRHPSTNGVQRIFQSPILELKQSLPQLILAILLFLFSYLSSFLDI